MDNPPTDLSPNVVVRRGRSRQQWGEVLGHVPVPHDSPEPTVVVRHGPRSQAWMPSQEAFAENRPLQAFSSPEIRYFDHSLAASQSAFSIGSAALPQDLIHFHDSYASSPSRRSNAEWIDGDGISERCGSIRDDPSTTNGQTTAASGNTLGCSGTSVAAARLGDESDRLSHLKLDLVSEWAESALGEADSLPLSPVECLAVQASTIRLDPTERIVSSSGAQLFNCNGVLLPVPPSSSTTPRLVGTATPVPITSPTERLCTFSPAPQPLSPSGSVRSIVPSGSQTATPRSSRRALHCPSDASGWSQQSPNPHSFRCGASEGISLPPSPQAFALSPVLPARVSSTSISPCSPNLFPPSTAPGETFVKVQIGVAGKTRGKKPRV